MLTAPMAAKGIWAGPFPFHWQEIGYWNPEESSFPAWGLQIRVEGEASIGGSLVVHASVKAHFSGNLVVKGPRVQVLMHGELDVFGELLDVTIVEVFNQGTTRVHHSLICTKVELHGESVFLAGMDGGNVTVSEALVKFESVPCQWCRVGVASIYGNLRCAQLSSGSSADFLKAGPDSTDEE